MIFISTRVHSRSTTPRIIRHRCCRPPVPKGGEVFHAHARALEAASPLLRDLFSELMTLERLAARDAVPVPPATGVDPALAHAALCKVGMHNRL